MAAKAQSDANRVLLLSLVRQWRSLGNAAEAHASMMRRSYATPPPPEKE
jgi:hypothetical protein